MNEETTVIQQNWFTLLETPLFLPLETLCQRISIQFSSNLISAIISLLESQVTAYAEYKNDFPFIGSLGILFILQFQPSMDSNSQYQHCLKRFKEMNHFEALFGFINIIECTAIMKWLGISTSIHKQVKKRLESKVKYLKRMKELIIILNSINTPDFHMSTQSLTTLLIEAFSLIQRTVSFHFLQ